MLTCLKVLSLVCKCVFDRPQHDVKGDHMELNLEQMKKMGSFVWLLCLLLESWSLKFQK